MQIVYIGDNLHEISNPVFWKKKRKKYFNIPSSENFNKTARTEDSERRHVGDVYHRCKTVPFIFLTNTPIYSDKQWHRSAFIFHLGTVQ